MSPFSTPGHTPAPSAGPSRVASPNPGFDGSAYAPQASGKKKSARSRYVDVMANPSQPAPPSAAPTSFMPAFPQGSINTFIPVKNY